MMKNLIILILYLFCSQLGVACECSFSTTTVEKAQRADFIATVEIISMEKHPSNEDIHIPKYKLIELFKGNKNAYLEEWTRSNSSCSFFTPVGNRFLVYAYKNSQGILRFGVCSGSFPISKSKYVDRHEFKENSIGFKQFRKIELLRYLSLNKKLNHQFENLSFIFKRTIYPLIIPEKEKVDYAIFEYSWDYFINEGTLTLIKPFENFENKEIIQFLRNNISFAYLRQKKLQGGKFLFSLHYYPGINKLPIPFTAIELNTL